MGGGASVGTISTQQQTAQVRDRLLAAPRSNPTRDIFPITLCEGEEQAQHRELAAGDNDWFRPVGKGKESLGQRLARVVAEGTSTDTTAST